MTVFLNILFITVGVLFFAGRLYEVIYLLEEGTNFLIGKGIVTTPLMLIIVFLISVCCGVIVFADKERDERGIKIPVGILTPVPLIKALSSALAKFLAKRFVRYPSKSKEASRMKSPSVLTNTASLCPSTALMVKSFMVSDNGISSPSAIHTAISEQSLAMIR